MGNPLGREAIYAALYAQMSTLLISPVGSFNYTGRRPVPASGLVAAQYPAFILMEAGEIYDRTVLFAPTRVSLLATAQISTMCGDLHDESLVGAINNLADEVEEALQSVCGPTAANILGGLVQQAWINHRQVLTLASTPGQISVQNMMIEIVLPHSR